MRLFYRVKFLTELHFKEFFSVPHLNVGPSFLLHYLSKESALDAIHHKDILPLSQAGRLRKQKATGIEKTSLACLVVPLLFLLCPELLDESVMFIFRISILFVAEVSLSLMLLLLFWRPYVLAGSEMIMLGRKRWFRETEPSTQPGGNSKNSFEKKM